MAKLQVIQLNKKDRVQPRNSICPISIFEMESGETLKRGCGRRGMHSISGGWRCFYCGRYLYDQKSSLDALWFHFRWGREYWRVRQGKGVDYINGIPIKGMGEGLPPHCLRDLSENRPPDWFGRFLDLEEGEFNRYIEDRSLKGEQGP